MAGEVIGSYRIIGKIGEGGMGAVYLAEHALIGRRAAIKVLLREMSHRSDLVTRFFNEARAATAVKHPGIVEIYDFGHLGDGSAYIVMEYLDGESLAARLRRTGLLSETRAAALCRQVAGALGAAHGKGIVHRDLKPDNIFLVRDADVADGERTKILDFGIAKLATGDRPGSGMTRTGMVLGTPTYMAPEQCKGAGGVDGRADLYALGCILYEMVCGRAPFAAEGAGEVMAQHIYAPVPPPSSIVPVTPVLERVILRALAKEPEHRFASAADMMAALQTAVSGAFAVAGPTEAMTPGVLAFPLPAPLPSRTTLDAAAGATPTAARPVWRRRSWIFAAVAMAAIAGGAGTLVLRVAVSRGGSDPDARVAVAAKAPPPPAPPAAQASPAPAAPPRPDPAQPQPVAPAKITIKVASDPAGADVYRMPQGVRIGATPLDYPMDATGGEVVLIVKKRGYADRQVAVAADRDGEVRVALARRSAGAPAKPGGPTPPGSTTPVDGSLDPFDKLKSRE